MRYFVIEDGVDVSAYKALDSAANAIEPVDIPSTRIFDEQGREYSLSIGRRNGRFLGIFPTSADITLTSADPHEAKRELEDCLKAYASSAGIHVPADASLQNLADLVAAYCGIK